MSTRLIESIAELRERVARARSEGLQIGLVPTMGALHAGHESLIEKARRDGHCVVVSIFVNPLQFDREEDLLQYPRSLEADLGVCARHGVDVVFAPTASEMYPAPQTCFVDVGALAEHLCGKHRPGHFRGVATVVMKLLEVVRPDLAYFGEKDAQQLAIVRRLVQDFVMPVRIEGVTTVREEDGLALSSRNQQLDEAERQLAPVLYRALREGRRQIVSGVREPGAVRRPASARIPKDNRLRLEYLEVVDPHDMQPVARIAGPVLVAGALWVGTTRLIDNILCAPPSSAPYSPRV
jgi:pantoate--beta-alanine ligase